MCVLAPTAARALNAEGWAAGFGSRGRPAARELSVVGIGFVPTLSRAQ